MNLTSYHSTILDVCIKFTISTLLGIIYLLYTFFFCCYSSVLEKFEKVQRAIEIEYR